MCTEFTQRLVLDGRTSILVNEQDNLLGIFLKSFFQIRSYSLTVNLKIKYIYTSVKILQWFADKVYKVMVEYSATDKYQMTSV